MFRGQNLSHLFINVGSHYPQQDCLRFSKGNTEELPQMDPLYAFHVKVSWSPAAAILEIFNQENIDFLSKHIRSQTRETYGSGWCRFQKLCKGYRINHQLNPLPLIVKFVCNQYNSGVSCSVVRTAILAISKYHIIDANIGNTIGQHPLVTTAKKAFWQLKPLIPRYHGTYNINILLRFIENLGQNVTLSLSSSQRRQLSKWHS